MKNVSKLIWLFLLTLPPIIASANHAEKIYLIASSTQYDARIVPHIIKMFNKKGYDVDTTYLDQQVSDLGYVNTDRSRAEKLTEALKDNKVKYLWFIRGGAGSLNLMSYLDKNLDELKKANPKVIVGFSDVTAIHYFINKYIGWPSVHGVMAAANKDMYSADREIKLSMNNSVDEVFSAIENGVRYDGIIPLNSQAKKGISGMLAGGNLTLVQSFFSTRFEHYLPDEVLVIEDVGVSFRQLDRALHQLAYKKDFHPKAIVFGQFYPLDPTDEARVTFKSVIKDFAEKSSYPVFYYPYFGHGQTNNPLLLLTPVTISCGDAEEYCQLIQPALQQSALSSKIHQPLSRR